MSSPAYELTSRARRVIFGRPKRTDQQQRERLSVTSALAVFSADGLSSVAYATEEILYILIAAGTAATVYSLPIGLAIVALVLIVAQSYSQTIRAYPSGGGSYIVSRSNLGTIAGLTAGAALLIDYVLTVAVSTAAGIAAVVSAVPALRGYEVPLELLAIWIIALVNMRGVRESGFVFSIPTYAFIISTLVLIGFGLIKVLGGDWHPVVSPAFGFGLGDSGFRAATGSVTMLLILRAFSSGCTALTGLEAVSNGVQAFRPPETRNAIVTMNLERTLLYVMFAGITLLAFGFGAVPREGETVMSQIARDVFGHENPLYYVIQAATAMILLLAANTAYADFPRLAGFMARDAFLPRRFANRGDTLVYNYGVMLLALLASVLVVVFSGSTHLLIPLYAVGVFTAFVLSQTGMVVHWVREARKSGQSLWAHWWSLTINALGAILCAIVLVIIGATKFTHGAWIVLVLVPLIVLYALSVKAYYVRFKERVGSLLDEHLTMDDARRVKTVLTIGRLSPVIDHSLRVARRMSADITAVYVAVDPEDGERIKSKWDLNRHRGVPLVVLNSPYRDVVGPLREYLDGLRADDPDTLIDLLVPIVVTNEPFDSYLHNGTADLILKEFRYTEGIIVTVIPFYVDMRPRAEHALVPAHHPQA